MVMGLRDGRGSQEAERLSRFSDPKHLIRTMPAKGDHPVDLSDGIMVRAVPLSSSC